MSMVPEPFQLQPKGTPPLFILTCTSLGLSTIIFIIGMLTRGVSSFWTVPAVYALTLTYHAVILIREYRRPPPPTTTTSLQTTIPSTDTHSTSSTKAGIACGALLVALWSGTFGVLLVVAILEGPKSSPSELAVIIAQCILTPGEVVLMGLIVIKSTHERKAGAIAWRKVRSEEEP